MRIPSVRVIDQEARNDIYDSKHRSSIIYDNCVQKEHSYIKRQFEHESSGSINLLNACVIEQQQNNNRHSKLHFSGSSIGSNPQRNYDFLTESSESSDASDQMEEEITIDETIRSIVNSSDSWEKIREKIRAKNLVTSLGVFEVCLPSFQQEAHKLKEQRRIEAKKEETRISKCSSLLRRLSIF